MRGYEPILAALRDRLIADLPARLDEIAGEAGDSVPLPAPRAWRLYATSEEEEYPVCFVLPGQGTPREQTGGWLTSVREAMVYIEHREDTAERLGLALMRYERAFIEAALGRHAPAPAHGIRWAETQPGPVFELDGGDQVRWQSWMRLTFELTVYEEDR